MMELGKILYSNKAIIKSRGINIFFIFFLFFINAALISSPLFMARASIDPGDILDSYDGLEEAFSEIYDLELDCDITDYSTCGLPEIANGYEIVIEGEPVTDRYIWFAEELVIQEDLENLPLAGSYDFLEGITLNPDNYRENSETIIYSISASKVGRDYFIFYTGQFIQNAIYLMAISAMLMIANYRQAKRKVTYTEAVKISVMAMLGPALVGALVGIVFPTFAAVTYMAMYSVRMMYIYYGILKS